MQRQARAIWRGSIKEGKGDVSTLSGALKNIPYSFQTRFENQPGSNPEELIAAAHASCFAMATSAALSKQGFEPESLDVTATVSLQKDKDTWTVGSSHLHLKAHVTNVTQGQFQEIAEDAKKNCPISRLLNAEITLQADLEEASSRPWAPPPPV
ncbi:OsmC family protein [Bdellovibrio sp. HCB337]|uniref:OsmC family protein n=1 Tax=Bdellovibrio sp. HCB337 TaxID=3394358 RepID=UPI0039A49CCB